jgi:hypothetical protein
VTWAEQTAHFTKSFCINDPPHREIEISGVLDLSGIDRSRQAGVSKPEVGQRYRAAGRVRVRQRSVIQRGAKVQVSRQAGSGSEQARVLTRRAKKERLEKAGAETQNVG